MKITNKNKKILIFTLVLVVGFCFVNLPAASADNWIEDGIKSGITWLLKAILTFMGYIVSAAISLLIWILDTKNINMTVGNPLVYTVWSQVRDVLNVMFILGLLFSAFCTVFQVSKFNYKSMLLTIVLMALLVNFSFPIARIIIDFSNVIMYSLLNSLGFAGSDGGMFTQLKQNGPLDKIINPSDTATVSYLITAIIFTFIFAVTLLVLAVLFVIRLVALTFLVIFSPIAFVGSIIPFLSSKASAWWDALFKYCFFGPVMVFMLYVSLKMMEATQTFGRSDLQQIVGGETVDPGLVTAIAMFSVPIVILWGGMGVAQSMSIAGAGAVVGRGQKFISGTGKGMRKWAGKRIDRGLANRGKSKYSAVRALQYLSPTALKAAWKQKEEEEDRKAFVPATGAWRDKLNKYWTLNHKKIGRRQSRYREASFQSNIAQKEKEVESVSRDFQFLYAELKRAQTAKDKEKVAAILRIIANSNDINDLMGAEGQVMDPSNVREHLHKMLTSAGLSENEAGKQLSDIGEIAYSKGNFQLFGMGRADKNGDYHKTNDADHMRYSRGKAKNVKAQTKADLWHWNSFLQQDPAGNAGQLHEFGKAQLEQINGTVLKQMDRVRDDFIDGLATQLSAIEDHAKLVESDPAKGGASQAKIIREFAEAIRERKFGKKPGGGTPTPAAGATPTGGATP